MPIENWRLFIQERLRAYEPTINLDDGSAATVQVVNPIVARLSPDPIDTNAQLFILTRLQQEHPQLFAEEGAAMSDLLAKPHITLLEPLRRENRSIRQSLSLQNPDQLTQDEADSLMRNFFMNRQSGSYARVRVRIYFQNNVSVTLSTSNVAYTADGLRFLPTRAQSITSEGMLLNYDASGLYYFDATYQAERPGVAYNIGPSQIIGVTGLQAATRATNLSKATPGTNEETTTQFVDRGESSMGERSPTTAPGTVAVLREDFPNLGILQIIGFNDEEMQRDIIKGGDLGPILHYGMDGATVDDGDADGYTPLFNVISSIDFTAELGPVGTDISGYQLEVWYETSIGVYAPFEYTLKQVEGMYQISISDDYDGSTAIPDGTDFHTMSNLRWSIRRKGFLTLSDIPGGLLFPDVQTSVNVEVPSDEVHVGGCVDVYVRGGDIEDKTLPLTLISDQDVIARREDAQVTAGSDEVLLNDLTSAEFDDIVAGETTLYIEEGANQGAYRIIEKKTEPTVRIDTDMVAPSATDLSYVLIDDIDVNLILPKEIRYEGTDLRTLAGSPLVQTTGGTFDFSSSGVVVGDYIDILNGDDAGEYEIVFVGGTTLTLGSNLNNTASPLQYQIYRKQGGIDLPLLRVTSVELLDSNLDPTGSVIPYRHPVDAQSFSFQNPGREARVGTDITITIDSYLQVASAGDNFAQVVDSGGSPFAPAVDLYDLGVRAGDIINITTGDNIGFYTVDAVGTHGGLATDDLVQITETFRWPSSVTGDMEYEIGPPSYGAFRCYFLDPVTFSASYAETLFAVQVGSGYRNFRPDPDVWDQFLPTPVTVPTMYTLSGFPSFVVVGTDGVSIDPWIHKVRAGDRVEITYAPIVGSALFTTNTVDLDNKTIQFDLGSGIELVTFSGTALDIDTLIAQMNSQLSQAVVSKFEDPGTPGNFYVMVRVDQKVSIISYDKPEDATALVFGSNRALWQPWLSGGFGGGPGAIITDNESPQKGYVRVDVDPIGSILSVKEMDGSAWTTVYTLLNTSLGHFIRIGHPGVQRISSTDMEENIDENGLYYFDVECISEGYGNVYNISQDRQATVTGYESEGWGLTTSDDDTSFSMAEEPILHLTPRVLFSGTDDDPTEKTELAGRSIQISYERDPLVDQVQNYLRDTQTRILVQNVLVRSLLPIFVRAAIEYRGGGTEPSVRAALVEQIISILPSNDLEADDLAEIIRNTGATKVTHPINLVGIAHQADRSITTIRSVDALTNNRLSALLPDDDGTTDAGASYIDLTRTL